jgi:MFS family permease
MTQLITRTPTHRAGRLSATASIALLSSIVITFLASSAVPTPLYAVYQAEWGFSPITTTVVFGVYAVSVLVALLVCGRLSDHVGRRPVLIAALLGQMVSMLVFATAEGVPQLLGARVLQGLVTGAALGAIGAGLLDVDRARGTVANSVAPGIGTASGALASGFVVQYLPAPTHLVYLAAVAVFAAQVVGVLAMSETASPRPGALQSLRPDLQLPGNVRRAVLTAAPILFAVWALAGFYGSLGPAIARTVTGSSSYVLSGLGLFLLAGVAAVSVFVLRAADPQVVMRLGVVALVVGVALMLVAVDQRSAVGFFAATAVAGVGFGSGFQGGIRTVMPLPAAHQRAGVLSVLYVVCYLGMGVPAVLAGVLVVHAGGLLSTAHEYGYAVMLLAGVALLAGFRRTSPVDVAPACASAAQ